MLEACLVPTYRRPEMLYCCLAYIRKVEPKIPILIFPDHDTYRDPQLQQIALYWKAGLMRVGEHSYHGNSYNVMEAFRTAFNYGFERVFYIEDDVFVHEDFFTWHRQIQEDFPDIFASMGWVFNRHAPIVDDIMFQPWYYSIGTCFNRDMLYLITEHASPHYYGDMPGYIRSQFIDSSLNDPFAIAHWEQDGLLQRVLNKYKKQTVSAGIAKCSHVGFAGYNRGWSRYEEFFERCLDFSSRIKKIESFYADPYWRLSMFDRVVVERELGREIPKRELRYKVKLPGGWESTFTSEMTQEFLAPRINGVPVPDDAEIMLVS